MFFFFRRSGTCLSLMYYIYFLFFFFKHLACICMHVLVTNKGIERLKFDLKRTLNDRNIKFV